MSVNYRADMITRHFGDGSSWGIEISYLREDVRLGTAGALALLPQQPQHSIVVMNADLLTRASVASLLEFHEANKSAATMAVRDYELQVPYGVVHTDGERITAVEEKPVHKFRINAGIYALSPEALAHVPRDAAFDMPALFDGSTPAAHRRWRFRCVSSGSTSAASRITWRQTCGWNTWKVPVTEQFLFQLDNRLMFGVGRSRALEAFLSERGMRRVLLAVDRGVTRFALLSGDQREPRQSGRARGGRAPQQRGARL